MKIEIGKTYLTRNGRFIKIEKIVFEGVYWGEFEEDGRKDTDLKDGGTCERYEIDGKNWNYIFMGDTFNNPKLDIITPDSITARELAEKMKLERKQKAYDETL